MSQRLEEAASGRDGWTVNELEEIEFN